MNTKKIIAFVGSNRKQHTYKAVQTLLNDIEEKGTDLEIESEIICLSQYNIQTCIGCKMCFDKGEEFCPLKDDLLPLVTKIMEADGIIFASPVYSFQVSSLMKIFIDRFAYLFHRPRLFSKIFTCIATQGTYGGKEVMKYLSFIGSASGCNVVKGVLIKSLEPMTDKGIQKNQKTIQKLSKRFLKQLRHFNLPTPTLFKLMIFRLSRTSMSIMLNDNFKDYRYYQDKGWFESNYYYPVKLNAFKKIIGHMADNLGKLMAK